MIEYKLFVHGAGAAILDLVRCALLNSGISQQDIVENEYKGKKYLSVFISSHQKARALQKRIRLLKLKNISTSVSLLQDADWKTRWKKYFKPFFITRKVQVVPVWEKKSVALSDKSIYLDTTFAFGTGLHATTRLMARFIESRAWKFERFLDIGTGTGILSIIAARYGARIIHAFDIDADSVKTARNNFQMNHSKPVFLKTIDFRQYQTKERFDFVAANLLTEDLIFFQKKLATLVKRGGFLAVSGIFHENYSYLRRSFKPAGLRCVNVLSKKNWFAVLFRKDVA